MSLSYGEIVCICLLALILGLLIVAIVLLSKRRKDEGVLEELRKDIQKEQRDARKESLDMMERMAQLLNGAQEKGFSRQDVRMDALTKSVSDNLRSMDERFKGFNLQTEQRLENIRTTMEKRIGFLQEENSKKLDEMRATVDEKLQKTLEDKIGQSFKMVSERLEQVYKGLGEMQNLAAGVGDLKKVLSNVKTRGILGEIQLGAILEQILAPEQYEKNVATKPGSRDVVEFAVKLPGDDGGCVYLPIDAKFPLDAYAALEDAYEAADMAAVDAAAKQLVNRIKLEAKDIHDKYISPPDTTDFAILFFPVESLYAEAVRRGLVEVLQRDYKVNIAGPTTMAALLNSLQMGFKTLAIQKRSGEVWKILGAVKTEFDTFQNVLAVTQQRLVKANDDLDKLVGVRTRQIQRKLKEVESLPETVAGQILETEDLPRLLTDI